MQVVQAQPIAIPSEASLSKSPMSRAPAAMPDDPKLKDACKQFEGQFFAIMLSEMQKTVPDDPELGDDAHEQQIFQGMLDDNIAQQMAKRSDGPNDLAEQMFRQLIQTGGHLPSGSISPDSSIASATAAAGGIQTTTESSENDEQ